MADDMLRFWQTTPLSEMSKEQWESLCDGCGKCCLHKLRDDETDEIYFTNVACRLLDLHSCHCSSYETRFRKVPDCVSLTPDILTTIDWLPPSCAYILIRDGQDLPDWHPLRSGSAESVHEAGISARDKIISERKAGLLEDHMVEWPADIPPGVARNRRKRNTHKPSK
ncbi:YcgN family cysteine cluster protein [Asaia prunellae]|uniref:YcgN family cysteine cluster protein n=1 Tax=Asaia prunellae TaxID=610245 RepID=UPI00046F30B5|nr:YcgN family cysteine cluster protein [Asaia prunellae]